MEKAMMMKIMLNRQKDIIFLTLKKSNQTKYRSEIIRYT